METRSIRAPLRATMLPDSPSASADTAPVPKRVASTRSKGGGWAAPLDVPQHHVPHLERHEGLEDPCQHDTHAAEPHGIRTVLDHLSNHGTTTWALGTTMENRRLRRARFKMPAAIAW